MSLLPILIQAFAGIVGGNALALLMPRKSLGLRLNTALGAIAGIGGGSLFSGILGDGMPALIGSAAIAGALLPAVLGAFRKTQQPAAPDAGRS